MKNKLKIAVIMAILIAFAGFQVYAAQQENEYRAYISNQFLDTYQNSDGTNATMVMNVAYVPIHPSATYTLTSKPLDVYVDLAQPTKINDKITASVKTQGESMGYTVIRVFLPSYEMKIP